MERVNNSNSELYVVAVGASAGGLEAIHEFFDNIPDSTHLAFIIIQHLSSDYKSLLVELVSKHTHMHVQEARHEQKVSQGCVYVIPNDKILTISKGKLCLANKEVEKGPNQAIDTFLFSLGKDQKAKAISVILSGTGTDGTKGAEYIKQCGGLVLVQEPSSAKFDGMPNSAISAQIADFILTPEAMADEIYNYIDGYHDGQNNIITEDEAAVEKLLNLVHKKTGYDFNQYKPATIHRRIQRRLLQTKKRDLLSYFDFAEKNENEPKQLAREFFIGVTSFFRDKQAFDYLASEVLPYIIKKKNNRDTIKVWVTACSTGQEAYSIAILLDQLISAQDKVLEVKIFASDIDEHAIDVASKGRYALSAVGNVEDEILNQYFIRHIDDFTIIPRIRKQIVFARHNILKDPPFIKNDLVSCRNILIYLNASIQKNVLSLLNLSLNKGAYLFLGSSENPTSIKNDIEEVSNKFKIYRKKESESSYTQPVQHFKQTDKTALHNIIANKTTSKMVSTGLQLAEDFKNVLIDELGYAALYINESYEIKEVVGDFRRYLSLPDNILNLNILRMVPPELSGILSTAFRKVWKEGVKTKLENIRVNVDGKAHIYNIFIQLPKQVNTQMYLLVVFSESKEGQKKPSNNVNDTLLEHGKYVLELEEELKETRANLQVAIEVLETTNEELQSSNEELQSANEELQSSNEELQSLNEELHTLNTEHQLRIKELVELNDDLNNYFSSTQIGQIFIDSRLRIRKFNTAATQMINIIENDIGRPINNISTNIRYTNLDADIKNVMKNHSIDEKEVVLNNGSTCLMRIKPYIKQDKKTDGVVITFVDISTLKNLNSLVKAVFDTTSSAILVFNAVRNEQNKIVDFTCQTTNKAAATIFNKNAAEVNGQSLINDFSILAENGLLQKLKNVIDNEEFNTGEIAIVIEDKTQWFTLIANKINDGIIITLSDISFRKESEEKLKKSFNELLQAREALKQLNSQLELKVKERTQNLAESEERFRLIASSTNDAIWDWSFAENHVWWSESFYNIFGYDKNDSSIHTFSFWMDMIHPEDKERVITNIHDVINKGETFWNASYRFKKLDGTYATILDRGTVMQDEYGMPYRMLGAMMDITNAEASAIELKSKNAELQNLIQEFTFVTDFMPQMVWATKADGYHDFFNKRWYDFTGLDYETTKDRGWSLILHPDDFERTIKVWNHSLATGSLYDIEYRMRRYDGEYIWFLARAMPLRNTEGKIIKWFGTCTDIHEQKIENDLLEQKVQERTFELQKTNADLETSNNDLLQFASVASHDLQEPLRKIHIFSNIIKDRFFKDESNGAADYIDRIIKSSSRATKLINDLLNFSRLSGESYFNNIDLQHLVEEVLSDIELAISDKNATIIVEGLPVIEAIPGQMRQVFQNLISNALKFSRPHVPPKINISATKVDSLSLRGC